jgi:hypothetical protein
MENIVIATFGDTNAALQGTCRASRRVLHRHKAKARQG